MVARAFITIHDQDLLAECESSGQFATIDHTYLFVGARPLDRIPRGVDIFVSRVVEPSYEHWPQFYDFTGWWALAKAGRLDTDDEVVCLQYDMTLPDPCLAPKVEEALLHHPVIAFNQAYVSMGHWMLHLAGFPHSFTAGLSAVGIDPTLFPHFEVWPTTQGTAWRARSLKAFIEWFEPLFAVWHDDVWAGHLAERSVQAWLLSTGQEAGYLLGAISHAAADCHGTGALMRGDHALYAARDASFRSAHQSS